MFNDYVLDTRNIPLLHIKWALTNQYNKYVKLSSTNRSKQYNKEKTTRLYIIYILYSLKKEAVSTITFTKYFKSGALIIFQSLKPAWRL